MSWASAKKKVAQIFDAPSYFQRPEIPQYTPDWARLVFLDFETFYDADYTLGKMSTSEYVRDRRFKAQMLGIKIGRGKTRIVPASKIKAELAKINWATHSACMHNAQFDGFILSHHYNVHPAFIFDTLAMARGLFSNDIGAGLDEVSRYLGGKGKIEGSLEKTKGVLNWPKALYDETAIYCAGDVDEMAFVFEKMLPKMPNDEIHLIDMITRMFTSPVLRVDIPRVEKELERELERRERLMYAAVDPARYDVGGDLYERSEWMKMLDKREREYEGVQRDMHIIKKVIGSGEKFAQLLRDEGVEPPLKVSDSWMKLSRDEREEKIDKKYTYAFAKDDTKFINLPNDIESWDFDLENPDDVALMAAKQQRLQALVDVRIAVKSTTNITRAERFLEAGRDGMPLPVGYAYYRAHTGRLGGNNKMNMQNLQRGGELRLSILAPEGHVIAVQDSGQIEARVNAWLWGQEDLLDGFRAADNKTGKDAYCNFADSIYGRPITKADENERFVGKVCLGPDTTVLTNHGLKSIIEVRSTDLLWDGQSWVTHDGLVDQGKRSTLSYLGMSATPDHEILTEHGWLEWQEVLTDPSLFRSALSLGNLPSSDGTTTSRRMASPGATDLSANAAAEPSLWSMSAASRQAVLQDAMDALRLRPAQNATGSTGTLCRMTSIAHVCLTVCRQQLAAVVTRAMHPISTMANGAFQCILAGLPTAQSSCVMYKPFQVGTYLNSNLTGSTTTAGTPQTTSGLQANPLTPETNDESKISNNESAISKQTTHTYDLANAGPNHQFTVLTAEGPVIVHNCVLGLGYQMGAPKLQITLAKGALGGPPVFFPLEQCHFIVNTYRAKNAKIKNGWEICKRIIEDMAAGREGSHGPINWEKDTIWLPNGMCLHYPDLQKSTDENGWDAWTYHSTMKGVPIRKKVYGGLLCENIVQALARIIVMWQMLQIGKRYRCVMTTHDEVAAIARARSAKACSDFMLKCMKTAPDWCADLPLNSEGKVAVNYSK